jgi:hypothetical protein
VQCEEKKREKRERREEADLCECVPDFLEWVEWDDKLKLGNLDEGEARDDVKITDDLGESQKSLGEALIEDFGGGVEIDRLDVGLISLEESLLAIVQSLVGLSVFGLYLLLDIGSPLDLSLAGPIVGRKERRTSWDLFIFIFFSFPFFLLLLKGVSELSPHLDVNDIGIVEGDASLSNLDQLVQEDWVLLINFSQNWSY